MRFLTKEEITALNFYLIEVYSPTEAKGILFHDLLESTVYRPQQSAFGEDAYPSIHLKAAAFFESLAQNHIFENGNKRVAFAAMVQFLKYNGYRLIMSPKQAEDFTIDVVTHKYTLEQISNEIEKNSEAK